MALGARESKEELRPLGLVLSGLLVLPEGKAEVERSCLGQMAEALGILSSRIKGLGGALGPSEQPGSPGTQIQARNPNDERGVWDEAGMI